jgi:hypothetical protein
MDFLAKARKLESKIARSLDLAVEGVVGRSARQPVEIVQAVLDSVEQQVQPAGRGRRVFPFNRVVVHVLATTRSQKALFDAVAEGPPSIRQRVLQRLESAGCHVSAFELQVLYASRAKPGWHAPEYHVSFDRVDQQPPAESTSAATATPVRIDLLVVAGSAERRNYTFCGDRIDIGRRAEVLDHRQRSSTATPKVTRRSPGNTPTSPMCPCRGSTGCTMTAAREGQPCFAPARRFASRQARGESVSNQATKSCSERRGCE